MKRGTMGETERIKRVYTLAEKSFFNSTGWNTLRPAVLFFEEMKRRQLMRTLCAAGFDPERLNHARVLDIGCGWAHTLGMLIDAGADPANLSGVDLIPGYIREAKKKYNSMDLRCCNAAELPFENNSFDIVMQYYVFSSILDESAQEAVAREMIRVVKPGGIIIWEDAGSDKDIFYFINENGGKELRYKGIPKNHVRKLFKGCRILSKRTSLTHLLSYQIGVFSFGGVKNLYKRIANRFFGGRHRIDVRDEWPYPFLLAEFLSLFPIFLRSDHHVISKHRSYEDNSQR